MRFDLERMEVAPGTPTPRLDDVLYSFTFGFAHLDVSRTGTLVYRKSTARGQSVVDWIDRSGWDEFPTARTAWAELISDWPGCR